MSTTDETTKASTTTEEEAPTATDFVGAAGEPRKMANETFDTEDESDHSSKEEEQEEEEELVGVQDAAMDILDQLVELFVEKNGREPNQEEVLQWIDVFKSLQISEEDDGETTPTTKEEEEETVEAPAAASE